MMVVMRAKNMASTKVIILKVVVKFGFSIGMAITNAISWRVK